MSRDRFLEKPTKPEPDLSENYKMFSNRFLQKLKPTKLLSFDRAPLLQTCVRSDIDF